MRSSVAAAALLTTSCLLGGSSVLAGPLGVQQQQQRQQLPLGLGGEADIPDNFDSSPGGAGERVNVSLYVMSRCPDARQCENVFEEVVQTEGIVDKINLHVGYIGTTNKSEPLGVSCKHGPHECLGNAHQLCVFTHTDPATFSHFLSAQNYPSSFPSDIGTVKFTRQTAETVGIDWDKSGVGKCVEGKHPKEGRLGKQAHRLLLESVRDTEEQGVKTSCTIDISSTILSEGKRRCVVDGGVWKGCDDGHAASDFVRVIDEEWKNLRS